MKKLIILVLVCCLSTIYVSAQKNISINIYAGSNAPWGQNQSLTINAKGECKYILTEVHKGVIDSSMFSLTRSQMNELYDVVQQVHFYKLNKIYDSKAIDGTGIHIEVDESGKMHTVNALNMKVKEISVLLSKLNAILSTHNIKIDYSPDL